MAEKMEYIYGHKPVVTCLLSNETGTYKTILETVCGLTTFIIQPLKLYIFHILTTN